MRTIFLVTLLLLTSSLIPTVNAQNALNFDGIDDHVQTTFMGVNGSNARTVEAWIRTTANCDPNNGGIQQVIADWGSQVTGGRFTMNVLWGDAIRLEVSGNGLSGTFPINDGSWHHVAAVYDPAAINQVSLYIDGGLDVSGNLTVPVFTIATVPMRVGRRVDDMRHFDGDIDEVRVWNYARSASEINAAYNSELCSLPPGLVAYYSFNHGVAGGNNSGLNTLVDLSGNGFNGTLQNMALSGASSNWVIGASLGGGVSFGTQTESACSEYTWLNNGVTYTMSGNYLDTLLGANGCDSIVTLDLTIQSVDTVVITTSTTLTAVQSGATYQWLDCDNGFMSISGATQQIYTPASNGNYAVAITFNGCVDTSACVPMTSIGIEESQQAEFDVFPNPTSSTLFIEMNGSDGFSYSLFDARGAVVLPESVIRQASQRVDLSAIPTGLYYVHIRDGISVQVERVIIR